MKFEDHFSQIAEDYAQYRPTYPAELFAYLANITTGRQLAWDCATGSGQAALGTAEHFEQVIASDASWEQLRNAVPHERIAYCVMPAEETSLREHSVNLVTAAVAVHWFHFDRFYAEVNRVLKPGGVIAVWTYHRPEISPEIDRLIIHFEDEVLLGYWPERKKFLEEHYQTLPFPFRELRPPGFRLQTDWTAGQWMGFMNSWSAVRRFEANEGSNPLQSIWDDFMGAWGDPDEAKKISWPLYMRVGRVE